MSTPWSSSAEVMIRRLRPTLSVASGSSGRTPLSRHLRIGFGEPSARRPASSPALRGHCHHGSVYRALTELLALPCQLVACTVVVQVLPGSCGAVHVIWMKDESCGSGSGPAQSSVMLTDPAMPSPQPTPPRKDTWPPPTDELQSAGELASAREQPLIDAEIDGG
jgi:hypothetical protein